MNGPLVNSLTQSDISSRATVLDIYLSQLAVKNRKRVSAVETVQEQCSPLNQLNNTLVRFCQGMHILLMGNSITKGQLISECPFDVLNFPKKQRKKLTNFCPRI